MFLISSTLILVSYCLIPFFIEHVVCSHFFLFLLFRLKDILYFVVQWSALPSCLLGGLSVLHSIHWTILVNMLFSYPVLLCLSCFQYCITISVCPDIVIQSVIVFDQDYVFLNVLKCLDIPFWDLWIIFLNCDVLQVVQVLFTNGTLPNFWQIFGVRKFKNHASGLVFESPFFKRTMIS